MPHYTTVSHAKHTQVCVLTVCALNTRECFLVRGCSIATNGAIVSRLRVVYGWERVSALSCLFVGAL